MILKRFQSNWNNKIINDKNGVKRTFLLLVQTTIGKLEHKLELIQKHTDEMTFFYLTETCQNTLLVPTSREVGSVKLPFLIILLYFQFDLNSFITNFILK